MPKISMIVWNTFTNDARVLKEAKTLQSAGYDIEVYAYRDSIHFPKREQIAAGIEVIRVNIDYLGSFYRYLGIKTPDSRAARRSGVIKRRSALEFIGLILTRIWAHLGLVFLIVRAKPQAIHAHDVNTLPTGWLASAILRVPLVYDAHEISTDREGYSGLRSVIGWIEKNIIPRTSGMITTTDTRAKFFALAYHVKRPIVLQNRPEFSDVARNDRIRQELNLKENWPIVLYQGGLQQGRGLGLLVEAASRVKNAYFVFIGGGRLERPLKEQVERLKLTDRVHFIKTVSLDDLPHYTASADIGVQALENTCLNHYSTDSNKLFEYAMAGLPVVATNMPEIRKIVQKFNFGEVVASGDVDALGGAIKRLVNDDALRATYGKNALTARSALKWEEQDHKLISLYAGILKQDAA